MTNGSSSDPLNPSALPNLNRRYFIRSAATAAGAVALTAVVRAGDGGAARPMRESDGAAAAWDQLERRLAETLSDLSEDEYLIITHERTSRFVQFIAQGHHGMRAEAVSNAFLEPSAQLSDGAIAGLLASGWHAPTFEPESGLEEPADGSPNFYLDVATPVSFSRVAALGVATLREAYGARHPGELHYSAASSSDEFADIRFPSLRLRHEG